MPWRTLSDSSPSWQVSLCTAFHSFITGHATELAAPTDSKTRCNDNAAVPSQQSSGVTPTATHPHVQVAKGDALTGMCNATLPGTPAARWVPAIIRHLVSPHSKGVATSNSNVQYICSADQSSYTLQAAKRGCSC